MVEKPTYKELEQKVNQLEKSESDLKNILNNSKDLICIAGMDGYFKYVSPVWEEILGYTQGELLSKPFLDFIHPDDHAINDEEVAKLSVGHLTIDFKNRYIHKDGSLLHISWRATPNLVEEIMYCIGRDITKRVKLEIEIEKRRENLEVLIEERTAELQKEISDRMQTEKRLNASEKKSLAWLEASPVCTKMVDLDFNLQYMSAAGINGLNIDDITQFYGKPYPFDFYPESFRNRMSKNLERVRVTGEIITQEAPVVDIEGNELWFHSTPVPVNDEKGRIEYIIVVSADTTDRKQAEESLRESEEKFRSFAEQSLVGVYLIRDDVFIYVNPKFAEIFGYTVEECLDNMRFHELVYPDDLAIVQEQVRRRASGELKATQYDFRGLKKSGEIIDIEIFGSSFSLKDRTTVTGTMLDITERKRAEQALQESEDQYRSLIELNPDAIYVCREGEFLYANKATADIFGVKSEKELIGRTLFDLIHPDYREKAKQRSRLVIEKGASVPLSDFTFLRLDNGETHVQAIAAPVTFKGEPAVLSAVRNITEQKKAVEEKTQLETKLQQAQKMESIGTLAGGIAHDFNNILSSMFGYLEMMMEDVPEDNPLHRSLAEVFNGAKRARDLVKQILAFSRQAENEKKPLKVQHVIREVLKLIRSSLPTTISIHQDIRNECELVMADPTQIHQVAMNLITNAYHAMEEAGGKMTVKLKQVELAEEDLKDASMTPGPHVCLTVADTGSGMDQGTIARIFDPYFTTKEEDKGTGLGLAVVHGIVKNHGGHISVYSQPDMGTEFKVYLPVIKHKKIVQMHETDSPIQKGDERILLVDDQDAIVRMTKQMLERLGYYVTTRASSTDALEAFRTQPDNFNLVITDLTMPNMTGDKLAMELMKIRSDIPVILCTGFSERMTKEKAKSLGIKGFLMKPVVTKELSKIIREVLDKRQDK